MPRSVFAPLIFYRKGRKGDAKFARQLRIPCVKSLRPLRLKIILQILIMTVQSQNPW